MTRIGNTQGGSPDSSRFRHQNLVLDTVRMPENGWVTSIGAVAAGLDASTTGELVMYDADERDLIHRSGPQTWNTTLQARSSLLSEHSGGVIQGHADAFKARSGKLFRIGVWGDPTQTRRWDQYKSDTYQHLRATSGDSSPPDDVPPTDVFANALTTWLDYTPNMRPLRGTWGNDVPSGIIGDFTPDFEGFFHHDPAEGGHDVTKLIQLRIFDKALGKFVYDVLFENRFDLDKFYTKDLFAHDANKEYYAEFRYSDTFDVWSDWSEQIHYATGLVPNKPTNLAPSGKVGSGTPTFTGTYTHAGTVNANAVQIELYNEAGTLLVKQSPWMSFTGAPGTSFSKTFADAGFAALAQGDRRSYRVRFRDANLAVGQWNTPNVQFNINALPTTPTNLAPTGGKTTPTPVLSAVVSDPDKDVMTARFRVYDSANALVTTIDAANVESGKSVSVAVPKSLITSGQTYTWDVQAADNIGFGPLTPRQKFLYAEAPIIAMQYPRQADVIRNEAWPPSGEYANAALGVKLGGTATNKGYTVVRDEDAYSGAFSWEVVKNTTDGDVTLELANRIPASAGQTWLTRVALKALTGIINARIEIVAYDVAGAVIGTFFPQAGQDALRDYTTIHSYWHYYGNVMNEALPAGTVSMTVRVRADGLSTGNFRVDAWQAINIPAASPKAAFADNFRKWFGYFSGDEKGYSYSDKYEWVGTPGNSGSIGVNRLTEAPGPATTAFHFSYFSGPGLAKKAHKLFVERETALETYSSVYADPDWVASTATSIPVPAGGTIKNQGHYRVRVQVQDANNQVGESEWAYFDIEFTGPPELVVEQVGADTARATLRIVWQRTNVPEDQLVRFEVRVRSQEEGEKIVARITDFTQTEYEYHYPVSARPYSIDIRQVANIGQAEVASLWEGGPAVVDYFPFYFIKDVRNPNVMFVFEPQRGEIPGKKSNGAIDEYESLWGGPPIHVIGNTEYSSGDFTATFHEDPFLGIIPETQRRNAESMRRGRFVCFLGQEPQEKHFIVMQDMGFGTNEFLEPTIDVSWTQTNYEEDFNLREGYE